MAQLQSCFLRINEKKKEDEVGDGCIADANRMKTKNKNDKKLLTGETYRKVCRKGNSNP